MDFQMQNLMEGIKGPLREKIEKDPNPEEGGYKRERL